MHREIGSFAIASRFMPLFPERGRNGEKGITRLAARLTVAIPRGTEVSEGQIVRYCIFPRWSSYYKRRRLVHICRRPVFVGGEGGDGERGAFRKTEQNYTAKNIKS